MAQVVETQEPVVREREVVHHDVGTRDNSGVIIAVVVLLIIVLALLFWRPWGHSSGGGTNINVTPNVTHSSGQ